MAYRCPHCGGKVQRGGSTGAAAMGGAAGALIAAAFGSFECGECGKIPRSEFSAEDRKKMMLGSIGLIGIAIALVVGAIWLITAINS